MFENVCELNLNILFRESACHSGRDDCGWRGCRDGARAGERRLGEGEGVSVRKRGIAGKEREACWGGLRDFLCAWRSGEVEGAQTLVLMFT